MSWYDNDSLKAYAAHLERTVDWNTAEFCAEDNCPMHVTWPNWAAERTTLRQVAEGHGLQLKVESGKAYLVK